MFTEEEQARLSHYCLQNMKYPIDVLFLGEDYLSSSQLYSVVCSSLCSVEPDGFVSVCVFVL